MSNTSMNRAVMRFTKHLKSGNWSAGYLIPLDDPDEFTKASVAAALQEKQGKPKKANYSIAHIYFYSPKIFSKSNLYI